MIFTKTITACFVIPSFNIEFETVKGDWGESRVNGYKHLETTFINEKGEPFQCGVDIEIENSEIEITIFTEYGELSESTAFSDEIKTKIHGIVEIKIEEHWAEEAENISDILSES